MHLHERQQISMAIVIDYELASQLLSRKSQSVLLWKIAPRFS
jgi:hypothetical protein